MEPGEPPANDDVVMSPLHGSGLSPANATRCNRLHKLYGPRTVVKPVTTKSARQGYDKIRDRDDKRKVDAKSPKASQPAASRAPRRHDSTISSRRPLAIVAKCRLGVA